MITNTEVVLWLAVGAYVLRNELRWYKQRLYHGETPLPGVLSKLTGRKQKRKEGE